ncbi:uncharacterized protein LOC128235924 isoform X2 [Mya arenaria]|uniref:uncharacterized protein LOC128235924 isoform X2 n=1 Tax=Mya arenaria TaxID=6604 RepID=UPI0022E93697|nr:uncharacterized protein LOC128235924 isoform X2 [Mya arenaria]
MEFEDADCILKTTLVTVKDYIKVSELIHYIKFTEQTAQEIKAKITNNGEAYSASYFFDAVKKNPSTFFPALVAATKKCQPDVFNILDEEVRNHLRNRQTELKKVLNAIAEKYEEFVRRPRSGCGGGDVLNLEGNTAQTDEGNTSRKGILGAGEELDLAQSINERSGSNIAQPQSLQRESSRLSSASSCSDNKESLGSMVSSSSDNRLSFDNRDEDSPLSSIQWNRYKRLGSCFEQPAANTEELWWAYMTGQCDIDMTRAEEKTIEVSKKQGIGFLDHLDRKGCSIGQLISYMRQCGFQAGLDELGCSPTNQGQDLNQSAGNTEDRRTFKQHLENNFNRAEQLSKKDGSKQFNIPQNLTTEENEEQLDRPPDKTPKTPVESYDPVTSPLQPPSDTMDSVDDGSLKMIDPVTLKSLPNTQDPAVKNPVNQSSNEDIRASREATLSNSSSLEENATLRNSRETTPIQVADDHDNKRSILSPGVEAKEIAYDRVHQLDAQPVASAETGNVDVKEKPMEARRELANSVSGTEDVRTRHGPVEPGTLLRSLESNISQDPCL